jgi:magnesium transporter
MDEQPQHFLESVLEHARKDFTTLRRDSTVQQALDAIRQHGVAEKIVYFYVLDVDDRLVGVVPTRRLLTAPLESRVADIMIARVIAIPHTATLLEACELFVLHKFLAFPVVDEERRMLGVVDVSVFAEEVVDMSAGERSDELFEALGFRVSQIRDASAAKAFRLRFPWLLATIGSGTLCALLASVFEMTLAKSIVLAFFLTLVLGLGESVSIQSMSVTIQALRSMRPTMRWFLGAFRREVGTALLLGAACGTVVGLIVWLWRGAGLAAVAIGSSILLALCAACLIGLSIPTLLHALKLDPKIAAGPVTLALTDLFTLLFYFSVATWLL